MYYVYCVFIMDGVHRSLFSVFEPFLLLGVAGLCNTVKLGKPWASGFN